MQQVTVSGNVGRDPETRTTGKGGPMLVVSLAASERRPDGAGGWTDGPTSWYRVVAYDRLARNAAASIRRGDRLIVAGELSVRDWTGDDGAERRDLQIRAAVIGHDLTAGTTTLVRTSGRDGAPAREGAAPRGDSPAGPADRSGWPGGAEADDGLAIGGGSHVAAATPF